MIILIRLFSSLFIFTAIIIIDLAVTKSLFQNVSLVCRHRHSSVLVNQSRPQGIKEETCLLDVGVCVCVCRGGIRGGRWIRVTRKPTKTVLGTDENSFLSYNYFSLAIKFINSVVLSSIQIYTLSIITNCFTLLQNR